ncbi:helix-turn-helix domain-containing protein [Streptomyces olivaceiscleroticus]|uniref:Helix-turn-helix domain-containing protein n=1 Tax=Streptomyces olivaceiscleroticus TaxID=68245 RepID=A0ABP3JKW0_9ACTN
MSNEAQAYVATLKVGDTTRKFILLRLADRCDERFSCFPSVPLLAAEAETSERTVQRHLAKLREMTLISDKERLRPDGSTASSRYFLHGPWDNYAGTGIPFETIVTPKQKREQQWAEPPREGAFRPGTAAAVALGLNAIVSAGQAGVTPVSPREHEKAADANSIVSAGQQGVTPMSPPPVTPMSPPPVSPVSPLEPTEVTPTSEPSKAPAARAAGDARRASAGSSAREAKSGSAASGGAKAPKKSSGAGKAGKARVRMSREQASAVATVEAAWPAELAALLPKYRPEVLRDTILDALDGGRSAEQVAERVRRRWTAHGYAADVLPGGKGLSSPVGVAVGLVRPSTDCPDPMCEDGITIHTGDACAKCAQRRIDRKADRRQGRVPGPREDQPAQAWWVCENPDCEKPGKGERPQDGLCRSCREELQVVTGRLAAKLTADEAEAEARNRELLLEEAYAEHDVREREAAERHATAGREHQQQAIAKEQQRLREELLRQHPELAAYAQT